MTEQALKKKLKEHFDINSRCVKTSVVYFEDKGFDILNNGLYEQGLKNPTADCLLVVKATAAFIREEIHSMDLDTDACAISETTFNDMFITPETLQIFTFK